MNNEQATPELDKRVAARMPKSKKPYVRPAVVYRQPLEAMASVCTGDGGKGPSDSCVLLYS
ncbi:MAG: hypothetical protein HYX94_09150 [Chloroflexi bacterium]|nr:hypothetical protein [Chloroflexota bacterium]